MKYEDLDIEKGFVLSGEEAQRYLKWLAGQIWERAVEEHAVDIESAMREWEDVAEMAQKICDENIEWVMFFEQPMSASEIGMAEMIRKESDEK